MVQRRRSALPVCPLCGHQDDLVEEPSPGPGLRLFTCTGHSPPYEISVPTYDEMEGAEGLYAEYGLDESLLRCVGAGAGHRPGDGFVEHAVAEYRLSLENPKGYRACLQAWGHTTIEPRRYTASVYIALRLGALSREERIVYRPGPGTGHFSYNDQVGYWAPAPADPGAALLSWAGFAEREGLDPAFPYAREALGQ